MPRRKNTDELGAARERYSKLVSRYLRSLEAGELAEDRAAEVEQELRRMATFLLVDYETVRARAEKARRRRSGSDGAGQRLLRLMGARKGELPVLSFLGRATSITCEAGEFRGRDLMFTGPGGRYLLIVPEGRVQSRKKVVAEGSAESEEMYTEWHGFEPDGNDFEIDLPDEAPAGAGYAQEITYESDKLIQAGDRPGEPHAYHHAFDKGKRLYRAGDCLLIIGLRIDRRGILN